MAAKIVDLTERILERRREQVRRRRQDRRRLSSQQRTLEAN